MSSNPEHAAAPQEPVPGGGGQPQPTEEEMRAAYEAELSRLTTTDMIAQAAVSLLNIGAHRMGVPGEAEAGPGAGGRDLEQVRDAIDGARALLDILERRIPAELGPLRDALSRLQMAYAREVQAPGSEPQAAAGEQQQPPTGSQPTPPASPAQPAGQAEDPSGPGPAESSGRLWVPGR